jgi:uncharacterized delta-60 repeat protein
LVLVPTGADAQAPKRAPATPFQTIQAPVPGTPLAPTFAPPITGRKYVSDQLIVKFKAGTSASQRNAVNAKHKGKVSKRLLLPRTFLLTLPAGQNPKVAAAVYKHDTEVEYAEPNFVRSPNIIQNLPLNFQSGEQWALHNTGQRVNGTVGTPDADIDAAEAFSHVGGTQFIAVIDTGIDFTHPELAGQVFYNDNERGGGRETDGIDNGGNGFIDDWRGWDFVDNDNDPTDTVGHGTHIAGTIAAPGTDQSGVTGVAPSGGRSLLILRACDTECTDAAIADAITYARQLPYIQLVNASFGGPDVGITVQNAINADPNQLFVTAAGNGGADELGDSNETTPEYPCSYTSANVLCVTATDQHDKLAPFANYGSTSVDLAAPGTNILSTFTPAGSSGPKLAYLSGTSQATAFVTGAAGVALANLRNRQVSTGELRDMVLGGVDPLPELAGKTVTGGRLNLERLVREPPQADGELDRSFGLARDGKWLYGGDARANAIATTPFGDHLVAGRAPSTGDGDFLIVNHSGGCCLQGFWGTSGGETTTDFGGNDAANAISVDSGSNPKFVVAGYTCASGFSGCDIAVARYNHDGTPDTTFSGDGKATVDFGAQNTGATGVAIQTDDKVVVAGTTDTGGASGYDVALARLNDDGTLDSGFGVGGKVVDDLDGPVDAVTGLQLQQNNKAIVSATTSDTDFLLARYQTSGAREWKSKTDFGGVDNARALALASKDDVVKIVAAGGTAPQQAGKIVFQAQPSGNPDIFTIDSTGTGQTQLTNDPAIDEFPSFSPDGTKIVFDSYRDGDRAEIYTMDADGTGVTRLTNNGESDVEPTWSADGSQIVFTSLRDGNAEIYAMNADGSGQTNLTNNPADDEFPTWSPQAFPPDQRIAFQSDRAAAGVHDIYKMNTDGSGVTRLTAAMGDVFQPTWSPFGDMLAFAGGSGNTDIYTIGADGTGVTRVTTDLGVDLFPSWSSAGDKIAFASSRTGPLQIYTISPSGTGETRVTNHSYDEFAPQFEPQRPKFAVARFDLNGSLDPTFGNGGKVTTSFPTNGEALAVAVQNDPAAFGQQRIVAAGRAFGDMAVVRYKSDGTLDPTFSGDGKARADFSVSGITESLTGVAFDGSGSITTPVDGIGNSFGIVKWKSGRPAIDVNPNAALNPAGDTVIVNGTRFEPGAQVTLQECNNTCVTRAQVMPDASGDFETQIQVDNTNGGTAPECGQNVTVCTLSATNSVGQSAIFGRLEFEARPSVQGRLSQGSIDEGRSIVENESTFPTATVIGDAAHGAPTGNVKLYYCKPDSPGTCDIETTTTPSATAGLTPGPDNTSTASFGLSSFTGVGRWCATVLYDGSTRYWRGSDTGRSMCFLVKAPSPVVDSVTDQYRTVHDAPLTVNAPAVLQNDRRPVGETVTVTSYTQPAVNQGSVSMNPDGSFTFTPASSFIGMASFTYTATGPSGSSTATAFVDVTAEDDVFATRYRATRYRATRYRTLDNPSLVTLAQCGPRFLWVNPQITLAHDSFLQVSATLYDGQGNRIANPDGYLLEGDFFANFGSPLRIDWPVWESPAPAGGVYAEIVLEADPGTPDAYTAVNVVDCRT